MRRRDETESEIRKLRCIADKRWKIAKPILIISSVILTVGILIALWMIINNGKLIK